MPSPSSSSGRPRLEPVALPRPGPSPGHYHHNYLGNVQLLEERYQQLCSSLRALYRSVHELDEALQQQQQQESGDGGGDYDENGPDADLVDAILENQLVFRKQRHELEHVVVAGMRQLGVSPATAEVPNDIAVMDVDADCGRYAQQQQQQQHQGRRRRPGNDQDLGRPEGAVAGGATQGRGEGTDVQEGTSPTPDGDAPGDDDGGDADGHTGFYL
jgi:hypothetical protein